MQTTEDILKAIESDVDGVTSKMLSDLIKTYRAKEGRHKQELWGRYTLKDVPIQKHKVADYTKVNEKIANDFYADVVDTKQGYMGNEVTIALNKEDYKEKEGAFEKDRKFLRDFQVRTSSEDQNSEMVALAGAVGIGYRLLYVPEGMNEVRTMNLKPDEGMIYVFDESLAEAVAALRFYTIDSVEFGSKNKEITVVEWYDKQDITYYIDDGEGNYHIDTTKGTGMVDEDGEPIGASGSQPHLFDGVPVIPFLNNGLKTAEPEKVLTLIDAYDLILSATTSEIEQLRLSYMFLKGQGLDIDEKFVAKLEQTGVFPLGEDGEVGFIDKQLNDEAVQNILVEIRKNIYQFSKSIDMSKDFGGDMRVIGWQVALLNLENSSKITERKFTKALREQYILLSGYWQKYQGVTIDPYSLLFTFTRNFPRDIQSEAETLNMLLTAVSKKTAYEQMSFIDDAEAEILQIEEERSPYREGDDAERPDSEPQGE